nr:xylosyl- and glucuronyltransferase LARGE1-like [Plodia interpunctella]
MYMHNGMVHVSFVCMGICMQFITPMLKSLLHHTKSPLHFHIISEKATESDISKLFRTWDINNVKYSIYNAEHMFSEISWIPNKHHSGIYGLIKILIPEILPQTLDKVIMLDYDLILLCDIVELWAFFKKMKNYQVIGLTEEQSNFYLGKNGWPALGAGFNSGVVLWDLKKIRENLIWPNVWRNAVEDNLPKLKFVKLADQDVLNAAIKRNPEFVYKIDCRFNVQLTSAYIAKSRCYKDISRVKIFHYNNHDVWSGYTWKGTKGDASFFSKTIQKYIS